MIRPLIYAPEKEIKHFVKKNEDLPIVKSTCKADGNTKREEMKNRLNLLEKENRGLKNRIFGALQRGEIDGFKPVKPEKDLPEDDEDE